MILGFKCPGKICLNFKELFEKERYLDILFKGIKAGNIDLVTRYFFG